MAGKPDVATHLAQRRFAISEAFEAWADTSSSASDRAKLVEDYFSRTNLGQTRAVGNTSVHVSSNGTNTRASNVLVVGRHDLADLSTGATPQIDDPQVYQGPGIGSRFGSTVAFAEGIQTARSAAGTDPVNASFLSLGEGDDFASIVSTLFTANLDAVIMTNAICWTPTQPSVTVGARGQIVAELTLTAGQSSNDFATSGAFRNPLNNLTQVLGSLRDERGRIAVPGFYDRARAPDRDQRERYANLADAANQWASTLAIAKPGGDLTSLERATMWPGVSILSVSGANADSFATPGSASAMIALYLVPDQRHAEIERALREWFSANAPADLKPTLRLIRSSRPYRTPDDCPIVAAQIRAAARIHAGQAMVVSGGGPAGAGELAYTLNTSVAFAGISNPEYGFGTTSESLPRHIFEAGVAMAAETAMQIRRS